MRKLRSLLAIPVAVLSLSACTMPILRKPGPVSQAMSQALSTDSLTAQGGGLEEDPDTQAVQTKAVKTKPVPGTKPEASVTQTKKTTPRTKPAKTRPSVTKPAKTRPSGITPAKEQKSPLPDHLTALLNKPQTGMLLLYTPGSRKGIRSAVTWDIRKYDTGTELFVVTRKKGSKVRVFDSKLTEDGQESRPDDTIRHRTTRADHEVIRIRYSDPETLPFNFIQVTEPGGKQSISAIRSSMADIDEVEVIRYGTSWTYP